MAANAEELYFTLRIRVNREISDIRFDFNQNADTANSIATELVCAELLDRRDKEVLTTNLQRIIELANEGSEQLSITFPLMSPLARDESPNQEELIGFAKIDRMD